MRKDGKLIRAVPVGQEKDGEEREATRRFETVREEPPLPPTPEEKKVPWWKRPKPAEPLSDKVIDFPEEDDSMTRRIGRLKEKADAYADKMFPDDESEEKDPEEALRDQLLPGVDYEDDPTHAPTPRKKKKGKPKKDIPPSALARKLAKGQRFLHARAVLSFFACLPQIYLMLASGFGWPLPPQLLDGVVRAQAAALGLGVNLLLGLDVIGRGLWGLIRLRLVSETLLALAAAASIADALTMPVFNMRDGGMPYCGVVSLACFFAVWSRFIKREAMRQSCRVAAAAAEPYLVTLDERMWNNQDAFVKWSGKRKGYGAQITAPDGAQRCYHKAAPVILILSALLALIASVGQARPELFFWSLSAILTAGCGFSGFLVYSVPYAAVTRRLARLGAALGGWDGIRYNKRGVGAVLTDLDLFPPGSITFNGIKLVGDTSLELLASYAATLVRETGSGTEKPFADLLRTNGSVYRKCSGVVFHEGGVTGIINGRQVYVGSGAFMAIMHIELPEGLNVKNAVFCAVDGRLEGIFALKYKLHFTVRPALEALIGNGVGPILATRDFAIIPEMLHRRFKLPADRMEFPSLERRRELSSKRQEHAEDFAAVLCREGLEPYADAVVGGKRLVSAVRGGLFFALLGAAAGMGLACYLTASAAFAALSAPALLAFLLLWLVPGFFVSGWANRY